tara:strand:- start:50 stop:1510 length:1461 start_codon:yes stop_codon:yes gene_type:complete
MLALQLTTAAESLKQAAAAEDEPAWQNGISTWNGAGYESPDISGQPSQFTLPTIGDRPRPYTLPNDPNMSDAVRALSAQHFAKNPTAVEILASPPIQKPLTFPDRKSERQTNNAQSSSGGTLGKNIPWQSQMAFSTSPSGRNEPTTGEQEASTTMTFSSLPTDALNNFLSTDPESLATESEVIANASDDDSDRLLLPYPETSQLADTSSADGSTPEASNDDVNLNPNPKSEGGSNAPSQNHVATSNWTSSEPAPLETEVTRWYQYPRAWGKGWDSHVEFGLDGSDGNANTLAMQAGLELKRKTERYTLGMDINYRQASSRNTTTEQNGRFNVNFDRLLGDTSWSAFAKHGMEWDKFKPFDLRLNLNGGFGYYWLRSDTSTLATRFGAGASREIGAPMDDWIPEAVFGMEAERQLTSRQKLKGKFDYFPAWENFGDYRLVSDVSWEILLDGSENLSLKLAATDRYDSTPQGAKPNDVYYSLLLLYKF